MANLTLSISDELLARGRNYAQRQGTSLNALVRDFLQEATSNSDEAVDEIVGRIRSSGGCSKGKKIERSDLHRY